MGPLITLFWTLGDICLRFQSQGGFLFACFLACVILRFIFGATPADCKEVSVAAKPFQSMHLQTCPQSLVGVWAGAQIFNHLCSKHSTVYHSATLAQPGHFKYVIPRVVIFNWSDVIPDRNERIFSQTCDLNIGHGRSSSCVLSSIEMQVRITFTANISN